MVKIDPEKLLKVKNGEMLPSAVGYVHTRKAVIGDVFAACAHYTDAKNEMLAFAHDKWQCKAEIEGRWFEVYHVMLCRPCARLKLTDGYSYQQLVCHVGRLEADDVEYINNAIEKQFS